MFDSCGKDVGVFGGGEVVCGVWDGMGWGIVGDYLPSNSDFFWGHG